jgi:hypothetical protein
MKRGSAMKAGPIAINASPIVRKIDATAMSAVRIVAIAGATTMIVHVETDRTMCVKPAATTHGAKRRGMKLCAKSDV